MNQTERDQTTRSPSPDETAHGLPFHRVIPSSMNSTSRPNSPPATGGSYDQLLALAQSAQAAADRAVDAFFQQREVVLQQFGAADYATKVNPSDADLVAYYKDPANAAQFQSPELASIEYVVLDVDAMKRQVTVSDDDLRKYYSENIARYITPEERRASHILIAADKALAAPERAKAKAKAEELLAEITKTPGAFAELARKNSNDPGSAIKGGDLDFFARGAIDKRFEDTAYALKVGQTSGVVESDFGFHIIRLTALRGGDKRSFDAVRNEIDTEVRLSLAQQKFAEAAAEFTNLVYEQSDSLKPAIDKFKLELKTTQGVSRKPAAGVSGPLASAKFLDAIFANDALRNKRNTDAVETAPSQLVSGRVVQHEAARALPLADVKDRVRTRVAAAQAAALAQKEGEARLAALKLAPQTDMGIATRLVSRLQVQELGQPIMDAVLGANASVLPTFVGVKSGSGYVVAKIQKVVGRDPVTADTERARSQYSQAWADAESQAYVGSLKSRLKVQVSAKTTTALATKEPAETR